MIGVEYTAAWDRGGGVGMCAGRCVCRLADHMHEHGEGVIALGSAKCSERTRPGDKCGVCWLWLRKNLTCFHVASIMLVLRPGTPPIWELHDELIISYRRRRRFCGNCVPSLTDEKNVEQKGVCCHTVNTIRRPAIIPGRNVRQTRDVPSIPHYIVCVCVCVWYLRPYGLVWIIQEMKGRRGNDRVTTPFINPHKVLTHTQPTTRNHTRWRVGKNVARHW